MKKITDAGDLKARALAALGSIESTKITPTDGAHEWAARDALDLYARARGRELVKEIAGDSSTQRFVLSTAITGWETGLHSLLAVEVARNPNGNLEETEELEDWTVRVHTDGNEVLYLASPVTGDRTLRIRYALPCEIKDIDGAGATTVPARDSEILVTFTAAALAEWISRTAADVGARGSMGVDQVDFDPLTRRWRALAEILRANGLERLSPSKISGGVAGATVEWSRESRFRTGRVGH